MSQILQFLPDFSNWTDNTVGAAAGVVGTLLALIAWIWQIISAWRQSRIQAMLRRNFGADFYPESVLKNSIKYYVEPYCANVDPSREAEIRHVVATKEKLFNTLDDFLSKDSIYRHLIILADSGMGKTSALLNYYVRNQWRRRGRFKIVVVPLGIPNVDDYIKKIPDQKETILFLDAFDEDTKAIADHRERLADLMKLCPQFNRVVMTCRTQFFPSDAEIPQETGVVRVGPRKAGEGAEYIFQKFYLMPLNDELITKYLRKRYPIWKWVNRRKAKQLIDKIPLLSARPMLLAHIPDLLQRKEEINFGFELYEVMIEAWLERESHWVTPDVLRRFSERLAIDLYINREKRGAERISRSELVLLAAEWNFPLVDWQIQGRSLLNRDGDGNYKFSHRSIMEYLFIRSESLDLEIDWTGITPTDLMISFTEEMLYSPRRTLPKTFPGGDLNKVVLSQTNLIGVNLNGTNLSEADLRGADLSGADLRGADLRGADLSRADLRGADLSGADLRRANLSGVELRETILNKARYDSTTVWPKGYEYQISGAIGPEADLRGADLRGVNLSGADLSGANLSEANLSEANLSGVDLRGVDLSGADLTGANLSGAEMRETILSRARYNSTTVWPKGYEYQISGAIGPAADLRGADLSGANLREANLREARYDSTTIWPKGYEYQISGAIGPAADLRGVNLSGADLRGVDLSGANLREANLSEADLSEADLREANLSGADLRRANLSGADLREASYDTETLWPEGFDRYETEAVNVYTR